MRVVMKIYLILFESKFFLQIRVEDNALILYVA